MIVYNKSGIHHVLNIGRMDGSVFPRVVLPSLVCATLAGVLRHLVEADMVAEVEDDNFIMKDTIVWQGFSFLVGFLIVFRTSMAYNRFWEGCTQLYRMRAEWMDAVSSIFSFTKFSSAIETEATHDFQQVLIRLFSMLHALALAEVEDSSSKMPEDVFAYGLNLIDPLGIDPESIIAIRNSDAKVELVFTWIQQLVVENIRSPSGGVLDIPPPILSRAFQELANGMVCFHEAIKVSSIPFPFPYAQTCDCLLTIHWLVTPLVVCQWFTSSFWAGLFTFIIVFILWVLNSIAVEIENPFGPDPNDIDCLTLHEQMNAFLLQSLSKDQRRSPHLMPGASLAQAQDSANKPISFVKVWHDIGVHQAEVESGADEVRELGEVQMVKSYRRTSITTSVVLKRSQTVGMGRRGSRKRFSMGSSIGEARHPDLFEPSTQPDSNSECSAIGCSSAAVSSAPLRHLPDAAPTFSTQSTPEATPQLRHLQTVGTMQSSSTIGTRNSRRQVDTGEASRGAGADENADLQMVRASFRRQQEEDVMFEMDETVGV